jgi:hypothetical protein
MTNPFEVIASIGESSLDLPYGDKHFLSMLGKMKLVPARAHALNLAWLANVCPPALRKI